MELDELKKSWNALNDYTGDVSSVTPMHHNRVYLFSEIKGAWGKLRYSAGIGGSSEYSQQIGCIELADKLNGQLMIIEVEQHSFKMGFYNPAFEVAEAS